MGYVGETLASLADPLDAGVHRAARNATEKVGDDLHRRVRRHTPISKPGAAEIVASYGSSGAWIRARGGRTPGTLYESWQTTPVERTGGGLGVGYRVEEFTLDPVAPHVEYPTSPHEIRAKRRADGKPGALTIPTAEGMVLRREVQHPGTAGSYMMTKAVAEVAVSWRATVMAQWARSARSIWSADVT